MTKFKFGDKVWHEEYGNGVYGKSSDLKVTTLSQVMFESVGCINVLTSELTPATDWVKCADKSPPFNKYVLIWDGEDQDVDWLSDTAPNEFKESHITHWMPLPAPPVEVE